MYRSLGIAFTGKARDAEQPGGGGGEILVRKSHSQNYFFKNVHDDKAKYDRETPVAKVETP